MRLELSDLSAMQRLGEAISAELRVGDVVEVADPDSGEVGMSPILAFPHVALNTTLKFHRMVLQDGKEMVVSPEHVVFVAQGGAAIKAFSIQLRAPSWSPRACSSRPRARNASA